MGIWFSTVWLALAVMYSRLHCQLSESLPLNGCSTFLIPAAHLQVQQVILHTQTHLNTTLLKRKRCFFPTPSVLWIKNASVCLFPPPLSISESSFWSFIHMIKSVHHHSVHSTFQYIMRPSLMSGKPLQRPGGCFCLRSLGLYCRVADIFSPDPLRIVWP